MLGGRTVLGKQEAGGWWWACRSGRTVLGKQEAGVRFLASRRREEPPCTFMCISCVSLKALAVFLQTCPGWWIMDSEAFPSVTGAVG